MAQVLVQAFVFARGGSKGVPKKNIYILHGKPLIAYTIETALKSKYIEDIVVSTDDEEIANISDGYGAKVPFLRPQSLSADTSAEWDAWRHAVSECKKSKPFDVFVSLPATAPLRAVQDIDGAIDMYINSDCDMVLTGCKSKRHPMFNMVKLSKDGGVELFSKSEKSIQRRQDASIVYDLTTVAYVCSPQYVLEADNLFSGRVLLYEVPAERALDIDDLYDMKVAEYFLESKSLENAGHC